MSKVIIIGGGVIGLFSAYYLKKSGWDVEIVEKGDLADNCSYGNAGMITPSHFVPLAAPGMIEQGIRWMFNSKSPFYVKPGLNSELLGWGLKFVKSATKHHVERSATALRDISLMSKVLYQDLDKQIGFDFDLKNRGILMLFKTTKVAEEEVHLAEKANRLGLDAQYLTADECNRLQPDVELDVLGAVHYHCDAHLYPNLLIKQLIAYLEKAGVRIHKNKEVTHIEHLAGDITSVKADDEVFTGDAYLLAGGAWSPALAKLAGFTLPLMPGKGYSFMVDEPLKRMHIPSILCEARVAITPMNGSIRFGGTMEIGRINNKININRVKGIVESVPKYMPNIIPRLPAEKDIWYGFRPCSPDGLPYIGFSGKYKNLLVATGHAMIGLGLAPATGKLINELLNHEKTAIDISLFSPSRFD
jgi:D-amino-acid dehydrogenase